MDYKSIKIRGEEDEMTSFEHLIKDVLFPALIGISILINVGYLFFGLLDADNTQEKKTAIYRALFGFVFVIVVGLFWIVKFTFLMIAMLIFSLCIAFWN
jgi:hypothetical protein